MNTISYFNKVKPSVAVQWTGTTEQDMIEFANLAIRSPEQFIIQEDGSLLFSGIMYTITIPVGSWYVGFEHFCVADENIQQYINDNWTIVSNAELYDIKYEQGI